MRVFNSSPTTKASKIATNSIKTRLAMGRVSLMEVLVMMDKAKTKHVLELATAITKESSMMRELRAMMRRRRVGR